MAYTRQQAVRTAAFLRKKVAKPPTVGLITGTGLGAAARLGDPLTVLPFSEIPGFPASTAPGQTGRVVFGELSGTAFLALKGRFHLYEGHPPAAVAFPVRVMQELDIGTLIVVNAAGGLNPGFFPQEIMILADHINLTGKNPLTGPNEAAWGVRFPDMSQAYDRSLMRAVESAAQTLNIPLRKGVYAGLPGPSLETPAEVRFLRTIGADAVGFSTVLEALAAVHAGMRLLGLSLITNVHDPDHPSPLTAEQVIATAKAAAPRLAALIRETLVREKAHGSL